MSPVRTDSTGPVAKRIAAAAAAGVAAGLVASFAMDRFQALTQPTPDTDSEPATQQAADALARAATGAPLATSQKAIGGQLVHYGLGAALGAGYGIVAEFAPAATAGAGAAFAVTTWAVFDEAAVPTAGWGDPPWRSPAETQVYGLTSHIVFGLVAEQVRRSILRYSDTIARHRA